MRRRATRQERRATRQERRAARMAMGGGEPPPKIAAWTRRDPLAVYDADGQRVDGALRNLWRGCAAFLMGGGPSLKHVDLTRLGERGVLSLGINNVAGFVPCNAFVCGDPASKFAESIWHDPKILKFLPRRQLGARLRVKRGEKFLWDTHSAGDCPAVFGIDRGGSFDPEEFFSAPGACWGAKGLEIDNWHKVRFTMFIGLRLLHFLGVRTIYTLGCDFDKDGPLKYAFEVDKRGAAKNGDGHWWKSREMLRAMLPKMRSLGLECYDVGPVSHLDVFERRGFDEAIADCQSRLGPLPPDMTGWYSRHPT
jgi:hypothetical protein